MLFEYKDKQSDAYNIFMNEINNNRISHAYLIDENNYADAFNMIKAFSKEILSLGYDDFQKKIICKRIDDNNYPELKIIEPDGMFIKKNQIIDLQKNFAMEAVEGNKRIYIIRDVDKMRLETANSMLKFLEEPDNNIVAILMTNNFNNLISTIVSRCQVIRFNNINYELSDDNNDLDDIVINFIDFVENKKLRSLINEQDLVFKFFNQKDRENFILFFDKIINIYYDIMKINVGEKNICFSNYYDKLKVISDKNSIVSINNKINYLIKTKGLIKNNININLLIDSVIVKIGGCNESCWS